jgi:Stage II sporulation protein E (SpoIIE)
VAREPAVRDSSGTSSAPSGATGSHWAGRAAIVTLLLGLVVTAALSVTTVVLYDRNENRLLKLRSRELNSVVATTLPSIQTPLASAAALADGTAGSARSFRTFMAPFVGPRRQFASASIWKLGGAHVLLAARLGAAPRLAAQAQAFARLLRETARPGVLNLAGVLESAQPALGFEFSASRHSGFAVYAESPLPANRRSGIESNSAFSDLYYVLYLGPSRRPSDLLVTNVSKLPLRGRQASGSVPFGASRFTLVVGPKGSLGGAFFRDLPWIVGIAGVLISLVAALTAERLARGRRRAEDLALDLDRAADELRERYREQQGISRKLQQALLPERLPELAGLQVSALYVPAASGVDVGGDWYDVVELEGGAVLLIVGDVSGHGLEAATTMALLRHAALAYAAQSPRPA